MNKEDINFDYKRLHPFKWFILENYPFLEDSIDVLTNYQLFCKLGEMYNKQVDAINILGVQVENITDWFDNLDVQEEINNKLDEMTESGELQEIISSYLNSKAIFCFDNISDMKNATNLIDGSYARTLGYYSKNSGGGSTYKIRNITNDDVIDEKFIIEMNDPENNLIAELIYNNEINVDQIGAYGDGVHDDISFFNACKTRCTQEHVTMCASSNKIYALSEGFTISTGCCYDFNNATIKALNNMQYVIRQNRQIATHDGQPVDSDYTKNIVIDCDSKADYGFYQDNWGWSTLTENIRVLNPKTIGIYIKQGQIRLHNAKVEDENGNGANLIGLQVDSTDSEYYNIVVRDCATGIKVTAGSNGFYECHPAIFETELLPGSKAFDISARCLFVHPIADTCQYGFYIRHFGGCDIISPELVIHPDYYNDETMNENPTFFYLVNGDNATTRLNIRSAKAPVDNIINNSKAIFTNATKWSSGLLILNNPEIEAAQIQGIPKEIRQSNSQINLASYLQQDYSATNINAVINGNVIEYRITKLTLPAISKNTGSYFVSGMPNSLVPDTNKTTNTITKNGIAIAISTNTNGGISITPLSANINSGDELYLTHSFIK